MRGRLTSAASRAAVDPGGTACVWLRPALRMIKFIAPWSCCPLNPRIVVMLSLVAGALGGAPAPVELGWLGGEAPAAPTGVSWGVPWPKGAVKIGRAHV